MKKKNLKNGFIIVGLWIGLYTVFWLSTADAGETVLYEKAVGNRQIVALQENNETSRFHGCDEEKLKKSLVVTPVTSV